MFAEVNSEQIGSGNDINKVIRLGCNVLCHNIGVSIFNSVITLLRLNTITFLAYNFSSKVFENKL